MSRLLVSTTTLLMLVLGPLVAWAHCDAVDGPVATTAVKALDVQNVNLVLPYVPAKAEAEIKAAFAQAVIVRSKGPEARSLADRYFMETVVRLHRAGEHAPYTGLKPAGTDFGAAIPVAEKAVQTGELDAVVALISKEAAHALAERFRHVMEAHGAPTAPKTDAEVAAARKRVSAELGFVTFVETLYRATKGEGHAE